MSGARFLNNGAADGAWSVPAPAHTPLVVHRRLPAYAPTPLLSVPRIAAELGVGSVWVKNESTRFGLPSFKMLGASWAVCRLVERKLGFSSADWSTIEDLRERVKPLLPHRLLAATDGNHGRAVARMAALLGFSARIFVPEGTSAARIDAIRGEGAEVVEVAGGYDRAVLEADAQGGPGASVVSDTAVRAEDPVPAWIIEGYGSALAEAEAQLRAQAAGPVSLAVVQIGVGALASAVARHFRAPGSARPRVLGVEPLDAGCAMASVAAGRPVALEGPQRSIMVGLNCGTPSLVAWESLQRGVDAYVLAEDEQARRAMRMLAREGIVAGETGAAGLAGLLALRELGGEASRFLRPDEQVLVIVTEGATDPEAYRTIVGAAPRS